MKARSGFVFGALILIGAVGLAGAMQEFRRFAAAPFELPDGGLVYELPPGTGLARLAQDLAQKGLVPHPWYFQLLVYLEGDPRGLKAGEYAICPGATPRDLLRQLEEGRVIQHTLTLIEGWTFAQVMEAVRANDRLEQVLQGLSDREIMARLGYPEEHPEGRFFPDTYRFPRGTTDLGFLRRANENMARVLEEEWSRRDPDLPYQHPYQALTLASIIEKETGVAAERPRIAGVFVRRLGRGMLLQTDPTVIYGLGEGFDGNLRRRDLERDGPYNTYTRHGLPPTPIAMPGRESIHAALHPEPGSALYFVARGDGSHAFSSSLPEHNDAVRRYQLKR